LQCGEKALHENEWEWVAGVVIVGVVEFLNQSI
jgi:hypothetical protein